MLSIGVILVSMLGLSAEDRFDAKIVRDAKTETTSIRISIPKAADREPIQSIYLQRKSATGLDLLVPIMAKENAGDYSIYMILPSSIAEASTIRVTHNRTRTPNPDGTFTSTSFVQGGESYEIALGQNEKAKSGEEEPSKR